MGDCFKFCGLLRKPELYFTVWKRCSNTSLKIFRILKVANPECRIPILFKITHCDFRGTGRSKNLGGSNLQIHNTIVQGSVKNQKWRERENSFEQGVTDQTLALTVFGSTYIYYTAGRYNMTFFLESPPVTIFVLPGVTVADSSTPIRFKNVL